MSDLLKCHKFVVPRFIGGEQLKLVGFSDASGTSFTAVIYLVARKSDGSYQSNIIYSRARVKPKKGNLTIPRLELLGVLIGARALKFCADHLNIDKRLTLFTDSAVCLHWLQSLKPLPTFVRNRVAELKRFTNMDFNFTPGPENPADLSCRGMDTQSMIESNLWRHGPDWLVKDQSEWPKYDIPAVSSETLNVCNLKPGLHVAYEMSAASTESAKSEQESSPPFDIRAKNYSNYRKLIRVTGWCARFIHNCKHRNSVRKGELSVNELSHATLTWIKHAQQITYTDQLQCIKRRERDPLIQDLGLFMDNDGLLRCRGRLKNISFGDCTKFPILLPRKHELTKLIIMDIHNEAKHVGVSHTLALVRKQYWIPQGRATVRYTIKGCNICKKYTVGPYKLPDFPDYPGIRVTESKSWTFTGLDYTGPVWIKDTATNEKTKSYILLLTCMCTRAVHLQLTPDLTSESFILAMREFIALRGKPSVIYSDNQSTIQLGEAVLTEAWKGVVEDPTVYSYLANNGIKWKYIPQHAAWQGSFYERLMQNLKNCLRRTLGQLCLTREQLRAQLAECSAIINSRPLVFIHAGLNDGYYLSPQCFLSVNQQTGSPVLDEDKLTDPDFLLDISSRESLLEKWRRGSAYLSQFWDIFIKDYVLSLRERFQRTFKHPRVHSKFKPRPKDVVLISEKGIKRGCWKLCQIESVNISSDSEIRSAQVRTRDGNILTRPINELYPLECGPEISQENEVDKNKKNDNAQIGANLNVRPKRQAAIAALKKLQQQLLSLYN